MSTKYLAKLNLRAFRYCALVVFLICNTLTASFSAWNLGIVQGIEGSRALIQRIDAYLAFLGGSGLVILFTIAFVEVASISWFIGTVWFEYVWISIWGLMYIAAAIAVTVIACQEDCSAASQTLNCAALQVLLAFTWLCAMTLIVYFSVFMFALFVNKRKYSTIWHSMMRRFPWAETCAILAGPQATRALSVAPAFPAFAQKSSVPIIHAPKPKYARPNASKRPSVPGLSSEYQIEHYRPPPIRLQTVTQDSSRPATLRTAELPPGAVPPVISPALSTMEEPEIMESNNFASLLYPMHLQQTILPTNTSKLRRPEPALFQASSDVVRAYANATFPPSPSPLGNWPRADILSQPVTKKKRKAPPPITTHGDSDQGNVVGTSSYVLLGPGQHSREIYQQPTRVLSHHTQSRRSGVSDLSNERSEPEDVGLEYA